MQQAEQNKLSERHEELMGYQLVTTAIKEAGVNRATYYRILNGDINPSAKTLKAILSAQKKVLTATKRELQKA